MDEAILQYLETVRDELTGAVDELARATKGRDGELVSLYYRDIEAVERTIDVIADLREVEQ